MSWFVFSTGVDSQGFGFVTFAGDCGSFIPDSGQNSFASSRLGHVSVGCGLSFMIHTTT